jgi:hypothetical protein
MSKRTARDDVVNFIKSVSTATRYLDFADEGELAALPAGSAHRIEELEDLLSRLSSEAEALSWRMGIGHELYGKRGK